MFLIAYGYAGLSAVNLIQQTVHVETVALLSLKNQHS